MRLRLQKDKSKTEAETRPPLQQPKQKLAEKSKDSIDSEQKIIEKKIEKKKIVESEFSRNVKDYLSGREIEILEILAEKKREFEARVRIDTLFGKQVYYLFAKAKKSVTDNDLTLALQKAQSEKMPALFASTGELNKKAKEHYSLWNNLLKFEKLRF
jgi:hypothetical protein